MLGGASLNGFGDVLLGAIARNLARFRVQALDQVGCVVARVAFDLFEQQLLRFVRREARDALELVLLRRDQLLILRCCRFRLFLAGGDRGFARVEVAVGAFERRLPLGLQLLAADQRLFERLRLLPFGARLLRRP